MKIVTASYLVWFGISLFMLIIGVKAQQAPLEHRWNIEAGPELVQISSEGIHVNQPDPEGLNYYGMVCSHFKLPAGKLWEITFDLKFGQLRSAGSGICFFEGDNVIGWIGADGWYKQMGCFVGKGNEVAAPSANTDWHKFEFSSDGTTVTITEDGKVVGSGSQTGTPNLIKIGDMWGSRQPIGARPAKMLDGQQTELWVRNVEAIAHKNEDVGFRKAPEVSVIKRDVQKPQVVANQTLRPPELQHQVDDFNDLLIMAQEANHNIKTYANASNQDIDLMSKAQPGDVNNFKQEFDDAQKLMNEQFDKQKTSLRKAMALRNVILANPNFATIYHETRVCLPPEEITTDMPEAKDLRFIEKRN